MSIYMTPQPNNINQQRHEYPLPYTGSGSKLSRTVRRSSGGFDISLWSNERRQKDTKPSRFSYRLPQPPFPVCLQWGFSHPERVEQPHRCRAFLRQKKPRCTYYHYIINSFLSIHGNSQVSELVHGGVTGDVLVRNKNVPLCSLCAFFSSIR